MLELNEIEALLPHARSWLMIDRVVGWQLGHHIHVQKRFAASDPLVAAHFAQCPRIVPGVLLIEMVGQAAHLLSRLSAGDSLSPDEQQRDFAQALVDCKARFMAPAFAEDLLEAHVTVETTVRQVTFHKGTVLSGKKEICRVQLSGTPVDLSTWGSRN